MLARVMLRPPSKGKAGRVLLSRVALSVLVVVLVVEGCALMQPPIEQRTTQGPTAQQMFNLRMMGMNGRDPTFEERRQWDDQVEASIAAYLRRNEDKANALDVSTFRYLRQAAVGQDKEQILILLGAPVLVTADQAQMQQIARGFWPVIQGNATELWIYPLGWNLFFAGQRVVDITQYLPN